MLDAFRIKPFDLEPVYTSWTPGPRFLGDPKKDPPVDDWLSEIKTGCTERNVPKEYWHTCGQHFMGGQAKARLTELKKVMAQVHGGNYRWNWKKFKVAMRNMSWDIDTSKTETLKVHGSPFWWMTRSVKAEEKDEEKPSVSEMQPLSRSNTITRLLSKDPKDSKDPPSYSERPVVARVATNQFWPTRKNSKDNTVADDAVARRPTPRKAKSDGEFLFSTQSSKALPPLPESANTFSTVRAPAWLLNAATALDFLQNEHPKVMSTLSAILIVAGTIPSLPVISAGAGGAVLASSTAHAVGALAVGIGSWLKTQQELQGKARSEG
ncbi:hypothetical protein B0H10DRAFT_1997165 [Mycena sp. CBHHK59/15]|nr:hypothetical protein B0H10DRAFT_1997165 [Mycena sp. CBHHK59/15]